MKTDTLTIDPILLPGGATRKQNAASDLSERQQSLHIQICECRCIQTKHQISKLQICIHVAFAVQTQTK